MPKPKYYTSPLFSNLDPFEVGYGDQLIKNGKIVATIHSEYVVERAVQQGKTLIIVLRKVWTDGRGQPVGGALTLTFETATVAPSPINGDDEKLESIQEIRDMRPYHASSAEKAQGYMKAVELSTDQGLWDIAFKEAFVLFDPEV